MENMGQDSEDSLDNMISLEQIGNTIDVIISSMKLTGLVYTNMLKRV